MKMIFGALMALGLMMAPAMAQGECSGENYDMFAQAAEDGGSSFLIVEGEALDVLAASIEETTGSAKPEEITKLAIALPGDEVTVMAMFDANGCMLGVASFMTSVIAQALAAVAEAGLEPGKIN
jgi:hypothetical protein